MALTNIPALANRLGLLLSHGITDLDDRTHARKLGRWGLGICSKQSARDS